MPEDLWVNVLGSYAKEMLTCGTGPEMLYHPLQATLFTYLLTYLLTYSTEPSSSEANRLVTKFPTFDGTRKFITAFTRARQLSLS